MKLTKPVQDSAVCPGCGEQALLERKGTNHAVHLALSVVSAGLWLLVWAAVAAKSTTNPYRCQRCGRELTRVDDEAGRHYELYEAAA